MEKLCQTYLEHIHPEDWEKTPTSFKKVLEGTIQQLKSLEKQLAEVLDTPETKFYPDKQKGLRFILGDVY